MRPTKEIVRTEPCPHCAAPSGEPCRTVPGENILLYNHVSRLTAATTDTTLARLATETALTDPWTAATNLFGGDR